MEWPRRSRFGKPDRLQVGGDQVLVGQIEARWSNHAGDHAVGVAEVVLVVAVAGSTVSGN